MIYASVTDLLQWNMKNSSRTKIMNFFWSFESWKQISFKNCWKLPRFAKCSLWFSKNWNRHGANLNHSCLISKSWPSISLSLSLSRMWSILFHSFFTLTAAPRRRECWTSPIGIRRGRWMREKARAEEMRSLSPRSSLSFVLSSPYLYRAGPRWSDQRIRISVRISGNGFQSKSRSIIGGAWDPCPLWGRLDGLWTLIWGMITLGRWGGYLWMQKRRERDQRSFTPTAVLWAFLEGRYH